MGLLKVQLGVFGKRIDIDEETKEETVWWNCDKKYCHDIDIETEPGTRAKTLIDIVNFKHEEIRKIIFAESSKQLEEGLINDNEFMIHIRASDNLTKHEYINMHIDVKITDDIRIKER